MMTWQSSNFENSVHYSLVQFVVACLDGKIARKHIGKIVGEFLAKYCKR